MLRTSIINSISQTWHTWWANERFNYSLRTLISLLGVVIPCWYFQAMDAVTPMVLGVIAAALSETEDSFGGKLRQTTMMLFCFALASFSIEYLFDRPWLFAAGLCISSFGFIMLGAIGGRYASIGFASLLLAVYTMLGAHLTQDLLSQPVLLLLAAGWHRGLSLVWHALWPNQSVQQGLARVYRKLRVYLQLKARLFEPVSGFSSHQRRLDLARFNSELVTELNQTKDNLLNRVRQGRSGQAAYRFLKLYFVAQDIHERAASSHYRYDELGETFRHSDILFRFQLLINRQAGACRKLAKAILNRKRYEHDVEVTQALDDAKQSLNYLRSQMNPEWRVQLASLKFLLRNLSTIEHQLANSNNPDVETDNDISLKDYEAHTLGEMWRRLWGAMTPKAQVFRHAVRLSLALTLGYGIVQGLGLERGYWILLTVLFVCHPNFSATRKRVSERMAGTVAGLLIGVPLLYLFPGQEGQLVLMLIFGVAFFATRTLHYGVATTCITLLVLLCFSQLGEGFAVILPRLGDTLVGCLIAALAVRYILPDWQSRHLLGKMAAAVDANRGYLSQVIAQYRIGKRDNLAYRSARRAAHNRDSELSAAISSMLKEPGRFRKAENESFRMLVLNHALLGYISALGAHRNRLGDHQVHLLVNQAHDSIYDRLEIVSQILSHTVQLPIQEVESGLELRLGRLRDSGDDVTSMVLQQLFMIHRMLDEMTQLAMEIAGCDQRTPTVDTAEVNVS
ncbi:YccS family putative transporter [Corallincola luteus]|uniref:YccS family putative transporter n=1 Tax=Corallincola luteus TaxID=1775177 RepID=UPI00196B528C|nr:YccS family putative transporter [Corallincola luteus]